MQLIKLLPLVALATANPVFRRQETSAAPSGPVASASGVVSSAASVVPPPLAPSGASSGAAPSASASSTANLYPAYPCPAGTDLTYVIAIQAYPEVNYDAAIQFLGGNWVNAIPFPVLNSTGSNNTGDTRTINFGGLILTEVLVLNELNSTTDTLHQRWNITAPLVVSPELTLETAQDDFTFYRNSTTGQPTAQLFTNTCATNQSAALAALNNAAVLVAYGQLIANNTAGAASSGAASSMAMPSSMMPSSMMSVMPPAASGVSDSLVSAVASAA